MAIDARALGLTGLLIVCAVMKPLESVGARPDKAAKKKFYGALVMGSPPQNAGDAIIADMFDKVLEKEFSENESPEGRLDRLNREVNQSFMLTTQASTVHQEQSPHRLTLLRGLITRFFSVESSLSEGLSWRIKISQNCGLCLWDHCTSSVDIYLPWDIRAAGTDYPTSNLFLSQIYKIKRVLDEKIFVEEDYIQAMVRRMKDKFDKYWFECNLVMAFGAVMDPRCKMTFIGFCFPLIYSMHEAEKNIVYVKESLYELFDAYLTHYTACAHDQETSACGSSSFSSGVISNSTTSTKEAKYSGWSDYTEFLAQKGSKMPLKSELDIYLEEGEYLCQEGEVFSAIDWWKSNNLKYRVLSRMAVDILAIPISTVASESTFSAGERVIDPYRSSLGTETVEALICGGDWIRNIYGLRGKIKLEQNDDEEKDIHIPML